MINFVRILFVTIIIVVIAGCNTVGIKDTPSALKELSISNIENKPYGGEDRNWNTPPVRDYKSANHHSPTPTSHPTANTINTFELSKMINSANKPITVNVLGGKNNLINSIPTSVWLKGFGLGPKHHDNIDLQRFTSQLAKLTNNSENTPLVFFCLDSKCWLSYNACLNASELGYANVYWYRGGVKAWKSAGLPLVSTGVYGN